MKDLQLLLNQTQKVRLQRAFEKLGPCFQRPIPTHPSPSRNHHGSSSSPMSGSSDHRGECHTSSTGSTMTPAWESQYGYAVKDGAEDRIECTRRYCKSCSDVLIADCMVLCCCPCALVQHLQQHLRGYRQVQAPHNAQPNNLNKFDPSPHDSQGTDESSSQFTRSWTLFGKEFRGKQGIMRTNLILMSRMQQAD
ncbi:hypothetical protein C1H46_025202 [Malus baccata]|uniref:Uncharacterized protein n=1 Tax=Malus baccata TaxID=106549 RepID=A0A540LRV6_MALBA|nr:hypothetical protein C1H46_025202 [Malus baccata]